MKTHARDASLLVGGRGTWSGSSEMVFSTFSKKTQPGYGVKQTGTASAYSLYLMLKQNIFPSKKWVANPPPHPSETKRKCREG